MLGAFFSWPCGGRNNRHTQIFFFPLSLVGVPSDGRWRPTAHLTSSIFQIIFDTDLDGAEAEAYWHLKALSDKGLIVAANLKEVLWHGLRT